MREEIKRKNNPKDELINRIIEAEWSMFDEVNNEGGRAACQDDEWTFYSMRYSQHNAFSVEMLESYEQDIMDAVQEGRNLLTEKYAYMMEYTDPAYFEKNLRKHLPQVSAGKEEIVARAANLSIKFQQDFEKKYPAFAKAGRPLTGTDGTDVSLHVYTLGELKTYSVRTLELYIRDMRESETNGENIAFRIHRSTALFYGYDSLDEAERRLQNR